MYLQLQDASAINSSDIVAQRLICEICLVRCSAMAEATRCRKGKGEREIGTCTYLIVPKYKIQYLYRRLARWLPEERSFAKPTLNF